MNITLEQKRKLIEEQKRVDREDRFKFLNTYEKYVARISVKPRKKFKRREQ